MAPGLRCTDKPGAERSGAPDSFAQPAPLDPGLRFATHPACENAGEAPPPRRGEVGHFFGNIPCARSPVALPIFSARTSLRIQPSDVFFHSNCHSLVSVFTYALLCSLSSVIVTVIDVCTCSEWLNRTFTD